eukprot:TRINITY_DN12071_c0_g1_i16.p1 TRINITY_DN12071_c0_g1~~TRINITY_DN12071_c0_g1_i16.p1  ORF type:complete len:360 (-),score=33.40 TRINITY_DN12071_c0_g1_i16:53-1024(-)
MEEEKILETGASFFKQAVTRTQEVYFELMKKRAMPLGYAIALITIMAFQIIGNMFYKDIGFKSENSVYSAIYTGIQIPRIYPIIEQYYGATVYWVSLYLYFVLIILYIVQFVYISYSIRAGRFCAKFPITVLRGLSALFSWALLSPIVEQFVSIYRCSDDHHVVDSSLQCWKGLHIFYCFLFTFGLLLYTVIGTLIVIMYNESRSNSGDALARFDLNTEVEIFLYRILVSALGIFLGSAEHNWIMAAVHILGSFYFMLEYLTHFTFYYKPVSYYYGVGVTSYFWFSINLLLIKVWDGYKYTGLTLIIGVAIICLLYTSPSPRD